MHVRPAPMKFSHTVLFVRSVSDCLQFYQRAFGWTVRLEQEGGFYAELDTGETLLAFASFDLARRLYGDAFAFRLSRSAERFTQIAFEVDDVAAVHAQAVRAGAVSINEPDLKPWGQMMAIVQGIDGTLIELTSRSDEVRPVIAASQVLQ